MWIGTWGAGGGLGVLFDIACSDQDCTRKKCIRHRWDCSQCVNTWRSAETLDGRAGLITKHLVGEGRSERLEESENDGSVMSR